MKVGIGARHHAKEVPLLKVLGAPKLAALVLEAAIRRDNRRQVLSA